MSDTAAIFIDGENLFYTLKDLGWRIDFDKFRRYFEEVEKLLIYNAFYYTSRPFIHGNRRAFLDYLIFHNYTVREKETKEIKDKKGKVIKLKCNLDVELSSEMVLTIPHYYIAILVSGDSDYVTTVKALRNEGKKIWCVSEKGFSLRELINEVDRFISLSKIKDRIKR